VWISSGQHGLLALLLHFDDQSGAAPAADGHAQHEVRRDQQGIRTYSRHAEELYEQAMRAGVQFVRYDDDRPPQEVIHFQDGHIAVYDHFLRADLRIPTDLLVLVVG